MHISRLTKIIKCWLFSNDVLWKALHQLNGSNHITLLGDIHPVKSNQQFPTKHEASFQIYKKKMNRKFYYDLYLSHMQWNKREGSLSCDCTFSRLFLSFRSSHERFFKWDSDMLACGSRSPKFLMIYWNIL